VNIPGGWLTLLVAATLAPIALTVVCGSGDPATVWSAVAVMTGCQALVALVFTLLATARIRHFTHHLGIDRTMAVHRLLGGATVALTVLHVLAVVADNPANAWLLDPSIAPPRALAGTAALVTLVLIVGFAEQRTRHYEWWRWMHRFAAVLAIVLIGLHVWLLNRLINVVPWAVLFTALGTAAVGAYVWRWAAPERRRRFIVAGVREETPTVSTVTLAPVGDPLRFEAGQFAWLRLHSMPWTQDHPFTLSSSADDEQLDITYRHAGDWTTGPLRAIRPGSVVWLDGPHGSMTLTAGEDATGLILIAAGVGLTPVLSVLRTCADRGDPRPMCVLTPPGEPLFLRDLTDLAGRLNLTVEGILPRRVDARSLAETLPWMPKAAYYVAGPPDLVSDTCAALRALEIPPARIHSERFVIA